MITHAHFKGMKREARRLALQSPGLTHAQARDQLARQQGYTDWSTLARVIQTTIKDTSP